MEDEVPYSTVVFNRFGEAQPKVVEPAEEVVYSEVKKNRGSPRQSSPEAVDESSAALVEETAVSASYRWTSVCLGLLCLLLLAGLVGMTVYNLTQAAHYNDILVRELEQLNISHSNTLLLMNLSMSRTTEELRALNHNLTNDNRLLQELYNNESMALKKVQDEKLALEGEKEELVVQKHQFNNTLRFITRFSNFPVNAFCQITSGEIHCKPCMKNWIQNGSSCYFFYTEHNFRTWQDSRRYCLEAGGDLAVIDNREEQEFIMQHTPYYYDYYHGYWIGLFIKNDIWRWITGNPLKNGFWVRLPTQSDGSCVLSKPTGIAQSSWKANNCGMQNRWVCEMSAVEWPRNM